MAVAGVLTVAVTYLVGKRLYGRLAGLIAAAVLAVMPYHVVVSRQVLLDGFMTLFATLTVYCVVLYIETAALRWMLATSAVMGLAVLSKETSIVLVGGLYAFFALTPAVRLHLRHVLLGLIMMAAVITAFPMTVSLSGRASTGGQYLLWQLFRRPNHGPLFYAQVVPPALGWLALGAAGLGLVMLRRESTWRERLLLTWVAVPLAFFCLWPVKGYQYLLPIAPIVAILAGRAIARIATVPALVSHRRQSAALVASLSVVLIASLIVPTWSHINPSPSGTFLSGTGGVPGAREAGLWVNHNVPSDAQLLAIGPSMANILEFYGKRRVYALSVSPEPANRNPAYVPVPNPDLALRQGRFQYLVWDSYTATRSPSFGDKITALVQRYQGVAVFTSTVNVRSTAGRTVAAAVVVVYQVRPS
jgi:hypothetical protein